MAGHSKFKNIMHRKGAQDKKRAKLFTKITKEIIVAAKSGADPNFNPRLRTAIITAKGANIPKDKIENAIKKSASGVEGENYMELRYEGYGPAGIAVLIETLTDNKNRTVTDIKTAFSKNGGTLAETGSVSYMFKRFGVISYLSKEMNNQDEVLEVVLELGAVDCIFGEDIVDIYCNPEDFVRVSEAIETKFGDPESAEISWKADNVLELDEENYTKALQLIEALEDCDDVQSVSSNFVNKIS